MQCKICKVSLTFGVFPSILLKVIFIQKFIFLWQNGAFVCVRAMKQMQNTVFATTSKTLLSRAFTRH